MNKQEFEAASFGPFTDEEPIGVTIAIRDAWILISVIQLACRAPALHQPLKDHIRQIADQLAAPIIARYPTAAEAIQMGWDEAYDTTAEEEWDAYLDEDVDDYGDEGPSDAFPRDDDDYGDDPEGDAQP